MDNTSGFTSEFKGQELRKKLLEALKKEEKQFIEFLRPYASKREFSKEDRIDLLKAIIQTIDHVMIAGDWNSSLFLRNTVKRLVEIKVEAHSELEKMEMDDSKKAIVSKALEEDEVEVYISLFQSDGYNMNKWAVQLRSLDRYIIGRPIYKNEEDVQKRIRLRSSTINEAYVTVVIKKSDIQMDSDKSSLKDQFDLPLLSLKEAAVRNGRIVAFMLHDIRYSYVEGQLIKV